MEIKMNPETPPTYLLKPKCPAPTLGITDADEYKFIELTGLTKYSIGKNNNNGFKYHNRIMAAQPTSKAMIKF